MNFILFLIVSSLSIRKRFQKGEDSTIDINEYFKSEDNFYLPLILLIISVAIICIFSLKYIINIAKDIKKTEIVFDLGENETRIDFTIAERHNT